MSENRDHTDVLIARLSRRILALRYGVRVLMSLALLMAVAVLNIATGREISFSIFYLIPVSFAAVFVSYRVGVVLAILSAVTWGYLEIRGLTYSAVWIPYWNALVRLGFFLIVNALIERLKRVHARERSLARTDGLTGVANARTFKEFLERTMAMSRRTEQPFTVAYIDLDRFKQVNDRLGHSEGDRLLQEVAQLMAQSVRATDVVARLGGDEFGILMLDTELEQAKVTLERLAGALEKNVANRWSVGASVGAVTFARVPESIDVVLKLADELMYQGKAAGRGRIMQSQWPI